jgi:hypothetical protein
MQELEKVLDVRWRTLDETKEIALGAEKEASKHVCLQEEKLEKITGDIAYVRENFEGKFNSMRNLKIGVVVTLFVLLTAAVQQYYSLSSSVDNTQQSVGEVKSSVQKLQAEQVGLKEAFRQNDEKRDKRNRKQLVEIKGAIEDALYDVKSHKVKKK